MWDEQLSIYPYLAGSGKRRALAARTALLGTERFNFGPVAGDNERPLSFGDFRSGLRSYANRIGANSRERDLMESQLYSHLAGLEIQDRKAFDALTAKSGAQTLGYRMWKNRNGIDTTPLYEPVVPTPEKKSDAQKTVDSLPEVEDEEDEAISGEDV